MAEHDEEHVGRLEHGPARAPRTRRLQVREIGEVTILVTGPGAARVADIFADLVPRLPDSDRVSVGGLVLVMTDPVAKARRC